MTDNTPTTTGLPTLNPAAFTRHDVQELVVLPLQRESAAMQVSTVLHPKPGQFVTIPVLQADPTTTNADPGIVTAGAEVPVVARPKQYAITLEHYKLAARDLFPWEQLTDSTFDMLGVYGESIVRRIRNSIDKAFFGEHKNNPFDGLGKIKSHVNNMQSTLDNVDVFLDMIEHAEEHDAQVNHFAMNPKTMTRLAKLKRQAGSLEPLFGVAEAAGTSTLQGVPLIASRHIPENVVWAIPKDRVVVSMVDDVTVEFDKFERFAEMTSGMLVYARVGMGCMQPGAVTRLELTS